jgi:hypothetical protein
VACENEPDACDLSEGIATDDVSRTITFSLVAPDPDFLFKLTLPSAYPVPPSVPNGIQKKTGIPGTGPYQLESPMTAEGFALVRNPHFRVWSQAAQPDGFVDRIEWSFGVEYEAQVETVAAGNADYAVDASQADGLEEILIGYPAQVHTSASAVTFFIVLNTEVPPFDNVDVRRAVNFAADRDRAVEIFGGGALSPLPTCQTIPPNFPGYEPYCPYTLDPGPGGEGSWTAPDLLEAQRLVDRSGTKGMRVVLDYDPEDWASMGPGLGDYGDYIIELLDDLGYRGSVRPVAHEVIRRPGREFQMAPTGWGNIYPAASDFMASLHVRRHIPSHSVGVLRPADRPDDRSCGRVAAQGPGRGGRALGRDRSRGRRSGPLPLAREPISPHIRFRTSGQLPTELRMGRAAQSALAEIAAEFPHPTPEIACRWFNPVNRGLPTTLSLSRRLAPLSHHDTEPLLGTDRHSISQRVSWSAP